MTSWQIGAPFALPGAWGFSDLGICWLSDGRVLVFGYDAATAEYLQCIVANTGPTTVTSLGAQTTIDYVGFAVSGVVPVAPVLLDDTHVFVAYSVEIDSPLRTPGNFAGFGVYGVVLEVVGNVVTVGTPLLLDEILAIDPVHDGLSQNMGASTRHYPFGSNPWRSTVCASFGGVHGVTHYGERQEIITCDLDLPSLTITRVQIFGPLAGSPGPLLDGNPGAGGLTPRFILATWTYGPSEDAAAIFDIENQQLGPLLLSLSDDAAGIETFGTAIVQLPSTATILAFVDGDTKFYVEWNSSIWATSPPAAIGHGARSAAQGLASWFGIAWRSPHLATIWGVNTISGIHHLQLQDIVVSAGDTITLDVVVDAGIVANVAVNALSKATDTTLLLDVDNSPGTGGNLHVIYPGPGGGEPPLWTADACGFV